MFPIIHLGPISIQSEGLVLLIGLWLGLLIAGRLSSRFEINEDLLERLVFFPLLAGIIGARLVFVLKSIEILIDSPLSIFSLNASMFDREGGLLFGFLILFIYAQRKKVDMWAALDALTPVISVVLIALSIAFLASGKMYGRPTDLPWGINLWGETRHPTQIYQFFISTAIFIIVLELIKKPKENSSELIPGIIFLSFSAVNALGVIILDTFSGNPGIFIGSLSTGQTAGFGVLIACILIINKKFSNLEMIEHQS
ncbi:MAG: prolipoprotein diacylglyceryl transferase [Anaerolineaceae bacterium]|nr:prolipoprotein diacylglyceryl transferase [Anaerolineaceae bacterium]